MSKLYLLAIIEFVEMWQQLSNYGMKLLIQQRPFPKVLLGLDMGMKSTGVSITSSDLQHAFYHSTIRKDILSVQLKQQLSRVIKKERPIGVVIGKPNYVIQSQQKESIIDLINSFVQTIHTLDPKIQNYKFTFVDQSWTTLEAKKQIKAIEDQIRRWGHLNKEKELIDGMAAINILRKYLQFLNKN